MELGFSFSLSFEDTNQTHPFGIAFINESQSEMVQAVETEFHDMFMNQNIILNSQEGESQLSERATQNFKERIRSLLDEFLSYVNFRVSVHVNRPNQSQCLSSKEYDEYIYRKKGSHKLAKELGCINNRVCSICLDELNYKRVWHSPRCGHLFHPKCLQTYLKKKCVTPTCPVCRENVTSH